MLSFAPPGSCSSKEMELDEDDIDARWQHFLEDEWESPPLNMEGAQPEEFQLQSIEEEVREAESGAYRYQRNLLPRKLSFYYGRTLRETDTEPYLWEDVETGIGTELVRAGIKFGLYSRKPDRLLEPGPLLVFVDYERQNPDLVGLLKARPPGSYFLLLGLNTRHTHNWLHLNPVPLLQTGNFAYIDFSYTGVIWAFHSLRFNALSPETDQALRNWLARFPH